MPPYWIAILNLHCGKNHSYHHDTLQQKQPAGFYGAQSLPDYQEEPPNQPKVALYELDQRGSPDRKRSHNICGGPHHLDRKVS